MLFDYIVYFNPTEPSVPSINTTVKAESKEDALYLATIENAAKLTSNHRPQVILPDYEKYSFYGDVKEKFNMYWGWDQEGFDSYLRTTYQELKAKDKHFGHIPGYSFRNWKFTNDAGLYYAYKWDETPKSYCLGTRLICSYFGSDSSNIVWRGISSWGAIISFGADLTAAQDWCRQSAYPEFGYLLWDRDNHTKLTKGQIELPLEY